MRRRCAALRDRGASPPRTTSDDRRPQRVDRRGAGDRGVRRDAGRAAAGAPGRAAHRRAGDRARARADGRAAAGLAGRRRDEPHAAPDRPARGARRRDVPAALPPTTGCAHVPGSALEDLGPGDAFVTLQERGLGSRARRGGLPRRARPLRPRARRPLRGLGVRRRARASRITGSASATAAVTSTSMVAFGRATAEVRAAGVGDPRQPAHR